MLSFSSSNIIFTGLNGNLSRSTGKLYRNRNFKDGVLRESCVCTIRNISFLSRVEIQVLAEKSINQLNTSLKVNIKKIPDSTAHNNNIVHMDSGSGFFKTRLFKNSLIPPYIVTARTLFSRPQNSTRYKPLLQGSKSQIDKDVDNSITSLDMNPKKKEDILLVIQSYVAGIKKGAEKEQSNSGGKRSIWSTLPYVFFFGYIIYITAGRNSPFGQIQLFRSNEIDPEEIEVTFADVKGCDEAKGELQEVVEFLINPEKFSKLGGRLPKGCLLVGPPGTGKTLLARAVAGEANVPFFHAAGPEFDEMLVGQGAKRVRDLFKAARRKAPCVIFIDEIDSVGSKRTNSALHPYANQTINQLLSEMDGFMSSEGVIVLGATNRADDLDKALLRPGRFDTQVQVPNPDLKGRKDILTLYLAKIKHDDTIDLEKLAKRTIGFSGADLENMVNTAAIKAAIDQKSAVGMDDFEYSHDKHVLGTDWKSRVRDKEDLEITAYHEAGHTLVAYFTKDATPIHKVTIMAKGSSGGHTAFIREKDTNYFTKAQLLARMDVDMGGRAAEELHFGKEKITGGARSDLDSATMTSTDMVKRLGMSKKSGLRIVEKDGELAPGTAEVADQEVNRLLNESYIRAMDILVKHRRELDLLAENLLQYETLDADDVKSIVENKKLNRS